VDGAPLSHKFTVYYYYYYLNLPGQEAVSLGAGRLPVSKSRQYGRRRRTGSPRPAGRPAGAVTQPGRHICQRRTRCRSYAGTAAAPVHGRHADCRVHVGRHRPRLQSGRQYYRPAASGLRVGKLRHLRCHTCRPYSMHCRRHLPAWVRQARLFPMF
jgi:hypothetical protein